ncbi:tetratricopeptide repeat protein [Pseudohaliea sp.]|uniref:tetratricopeptide repeat protein n=1 Tax=Pseudohaliea sp. TaxID=2740289 RepID=UPI0032EC8C7F
MKKRIWRVVLFYWFVGCIGAPVAASSWVGSDFTGLRCSGKPTGVGPFDYLQRAAFADKLTLVERFHFTPEVEKLVRGKSGAIESDLDYTLRAWPNHHRALNAMMRLQARLDRAGMQRLKASQVPAVECYLQRAITFSPGDATARMLFAMLLQRTGNLQEAGQMYDAAIKLAPQDLQLQYNYGLFLVETGELERAREIADRVYGQGFPLPGLQRKLEAASTH